MLDAILIVHLVIAVEVALLVFLKVLSEIKK